MTDTTANENETPRVNIAADGDLVLVINNNSELLVHSFILKTSSPVFQVMLGPHWLEGQSLANISSTSPGTLKLPDDDPEAMKYLCLMLHNCHDELMTAPSHALLLNFAKAADKYRCISSTRLIFELWISRLANLKYYEIGYSHLATAYILEDAAVFEDLSRQVLLKSSPHEFRIFCKSATGRDDFGIVAAFMLRYALLRNIVIGGVDRMVEEMCKLLGPDMKHYVDNIPGITDEDAKQFVRRRRGGLPKFCDYYQKMTGEHLALFAEARIWPDCRAEGLESLIQKLKHFNLPEIHFDDGQCMREDFWEDNWFISDLPPALAALKAIADHVDTALCVHCVKSVDGVGCAEHEGLRVIPSLSKQTLMTVHLEQVRFEYGDL